MARKPIFNNPNEMQKLIDKYFKSLKPKLIKVSGNPVISSNTGLPIYSEELAPTIAGLTRALGFHSKQTLYNYRKDENYSDIIDDAILRVEEYAERMLFSKEGARGAQFSLTYNFKYKNKQEEKEEKSGGVVLIPKRNET